MRYLYIYYILKLNIFLIYRLLGILVLIKYPGYLSGVALSFFRGPAIKCWAEAFNISLSKSCNIFISMTSTRSGVPRLRSFPYTLSPVFHQRIFLSSLSKIVSLIWAIHLLLFVHLDPTFQLRSAIHTIQACWWKKLFFVKRYYQWTWVYCGSKIWGLRFWFLGSSLKLQNTLSFQISHLSWSILNFRRS